MSVRYPGRSAAYTHHMTVMAGHKLGRAQGATDQWVLHGQPDSLQQRFRAVAAQLPAGVLGLAVGARTCQGIGGGGGGDSA